LALHSTRLLVQHEVEAFNIASDVVVGFQWDGVGVVQFSVAAGNKGKGHSVLALQRMQRIFLVIILLFEVIITGEWSEENSRQDSMGQKFLEMPLIMPKSSKSGLFLLSDGQ